MRQSRRFLFYLSNALLLLSCVFADSEICAVGLAKDTTWEVTVLSLCTAGHLALGTYVDSGFTNAFSRVYVKLDSQLEIVKYLYLIVTTTTIPTKIWYISTNLPMSNTASGTYDVRFTVSSQNQTIDSIVGAQAHAKCTSTSAGSGIEVQNQNITSLVQVTKCKCDYNYELRAGSCQLCGDTRFKNTISNSSCRNCPNNKVFTDIKTCTCLPGSSGLMGEICVPCLAGFYNTDGGSVTCSACPLHTSSRVESNTITNCTCNRGYSGQDAGPCTICAAGKYKDTQGDNMCSDCPEGKYSDEIGATTSNTCRNCTSKSTSPAGSNNQSACACAAGWYGVLGQNCSKCGSDTFSSIPGSSSCTQCPFGRSAPLGGDSIDACICMKGSDTECECAEGSTNVYQFEFHISTFTCNLQGVGSGLFIDTGLLNSGSPVYYSATPQPKFLYRNDESWLVSSLFNALTYDIAFSGCSYTPETVDNLASTMWNCANALSCGGQIVWNSGGQTSVANVSRCICNTNFVRSRFGICTQCPTGFFKSVFLNGSSECRICPTASSTLDPSEGVDGCGCNAGFSGPNNGVCIQCAPGTHKFGIGPTSCQKCPAILHPLHMAFNISSRVLNCNTCQIGHAWNHETQQCKQCASDEFNNQAGDSVCFKCVATPEYFPLQQNMQLWFKFDNIPERNSKTNVNDILVVDSSVHQRHGLYQWNPHGPTKDAQNRVIGIYDLTDFKEGNASYANYNHDVKLSSAYLGGDFSLLFFFKSYGDGRFMFLQERNQVDITISRIGDQLHFKGSHLSLNLNTQIPNGGIKFNTWYHFAWVVERSLARWTIYIDGERTPLPIGFAPPLLATERFYNILFARHKMDDLRVYNRAVTRLEVRTAYLQRDPNEICGLTESNGVTCPRLCRVNAGFQITLSGANVELCPRNTYQNGYFLTCQSCPIGSSTNTSGNTDISACICSAGYSRNGLATGACVACAVGKFKAVSGSDACTHCATGQFSDTGAVICGCDQGFTGDLAIKPCEACEAGKYKSTTGSVQCTLCGILRSSAVGSRHMSDCQCNIGFMGPDTGTCESEQLCPLNADKPIGSLRTSCLCNAGYIGPDMWGPCESCEAGKYKEVAGSALCDFCDPDSISMAASTSKSACTCLPGFHGADGCTACSPGKYQAFLGTALCASCPLNSISPVASAQLVSCVCNQGFTGPHGMECTACASGKYKDVVGSGACRDCSQFSNSQQQSTSQNECYCNVGYSRNIDDDLPNTNVDIATQKTGVGGWRLVRFMPPRFYKERWYKMCDKLEGTITVGDAYNNQTDWTIPFGVHDELLFGTYNLRHWVRLPKSSTRGQTYNTLFRSAFSSSLNPNPHSPVVKITEQTAGIGWPLISLTQTPHNMDTIAYQESVAIWGPGLEMEAGRKVITDVDGGMAVWVRSSSPTWCRICEPNTFNSDVGSRTCTKCPNNSVATGFAGSSQTVCICTAGYYGPNGGPCEACPVGTYSTHVSAKSCLPCAENTVSSPGSTHCQCNVGWTGPDNGPCTACDIGTSKGIPGSSVCKTCPANTEATSKGRSHCLCVIGLLGNGLVYAHESPPRQKIPTLRDTTLVQQKTGKDGWRLVRFLPPWSDTWYAGNDNLGGKSTRGFAYDNSNEWSIPFGEFDEFCFSTLNFLHWVYCTKDAAIGTMYGTNSPRAIIRSSISTSSYTAKWRFRPGTGWENPMDPSIGLRNHEAAPRNTNTGDRILYEEISVPWNPNNAGSWTRSTIASDGGMCVWVRSSTVALPVLAPKQELSLGHFVVGYPQSRVVRVTSAVFDFVLPSGYNKVSVNARNYRSENGMSVILGGVHLPLLDVSSSQKCGAAKIATISFTAGDTLRVTENIVNFAGELFLELELDPIDIVDCVPCPAGYIISSDNGTCVSCGFNMYNPTVGGLECIPCPEGTRSPPGSSDLKHCKCRGEENGTSGLTGPDGGLCKMCPQEYYKILPGSMSCDKITNVSSVITLPHAINTEIRNILNRGFRQDWFPGDQLRVHRRGYRGHDDVVLTLISSAVRGLVWVPANVSPRVEPGDRFLFLVRSKTLLQKNESEIEFNTVL